MLFLITISVFLSTLAFQAGHVKAATPITYADGRFMWGEGVVFIFEATGYRTRDVRDTTIFVGSNFHELGCKVNKEKTRIVCIGRGGLTEYAGQTGIIHLAGQLFNVTFYYAEGQPDTYFIPGNALAEVQQTVQSWMDDSEGYITVFAIAGGLVCGAMPQ